MEVTATLGSTEGEVNFAINTSLPKGGEAMTRYPTTTHCKRGRLNEYHVQSQSYTWFFSIDHQHIPISRYVNDPRRDDMRMTRRADTRALFFVHNRIVQLIERYRQTIEINLIHQALGANVRADLSVARELPGSISFMLLMRANTQFYQSHRNISAPSLGSKPKM